MTQDHSVTEYHWTRALTLWAGGRCRECHLRGAELCRALCERHVLRDGPPPLRHYDKGKIILERGEPFGSLGVIRRGFARRSEMRMNGKRVLFGLSIPGDTLGGLPGQTSGCDLEAATDLEICVYDSALVNWHLTHNPRLRQVLMHEAERQQYRFLNSLWRYGTLNSRERIIAFLVMAAGFMPTEPLPDGSLVLTMEIERRDWADLTNTAVETISRTLRFLEAAALLTSLSAYRFRIHDPDRLALIAGLEPVRRPDPRKRRERSNSALPMTAVIAPVRPAASVTPSRNP